MILNTKNSEKLLSKINKLHIVSLIIQVLLIAVLYFLSVKKEDFLIAGQETIIYLQYLMIFITLLIIPGSEYLLKQKLKKIINLPNKDEKIQQYLTSILVKLSLVEACSVLSIVIYYLSGSKTFIYISVILTLFFLLSKPGKNKIFNDLNIQHGKTEPGDLD